MSSCLAGAARNTATAAAAAAATYGFDHDVEFIKSASTSIRASPHSSSSSCFTSSSPNSTFSESSNPLSPPLYICTRKPRTPRKRPNQTYNEAAALLSTAYPNIFSATEHRRNHHSLSNNTPSFKFQKSPIVDEEEELLLPLALPEKHFEPRAGLAASGGEPCRSAVEEDFDTESILDEEIEGGIDSIMGNLTVKGENCNLDHQFLQNQHQTSTITANDNFCYGIPMGLGLGLLSGRFDFGFGLTRGVRAFRDTGYGAGAAGEWWRFPAITTVDVGAISPRMEVKPVVVEKKKCSNKKKKMPEEASPAAAETVAEEEVSGSDCRIELKLNYEDVLSAWSDRGSPFADDSAASEYSGKEGLARLAQIDLFGESGGIREASVQRYKEKRRTRLFSKKIRYQVRKVNADQRPRMKGRFVRGTESGADVQP